MSSLVIIIHLCLIVSLLTTKRNATVVSTRPLSCFARSRIFVLEWRPPRNSPAGGAAKVSITPPSIMASSSSVFSALREDPSQTFLLDGGTGEELFRLGLPDDRKIWSAKAVVDPKYHALLQQVHKSFCSAGSRAITTNSYGIVPGVGFSREEISTHCETAARLAHEAVKGTDTLALGSLGPLVESYRPDLTMEHGLGVATYAAMITAMESYVDCFLAETMSSVEESMQAVGAMSQTTAKQSPLLISYTLRTDGCLRSGEAANLAIPRILKYAAEKNINGRSTRFCTGTR